MRRKLLAPPEPKSNRRQLPQPVVEKSKPDDDPMSNKFNKIMHCGTERLVGRNFQRNLD